MNNLSKHHSAGPAEVRGPMQLHWLHRLEASPAYLHYSNQIDESKLEFFNQGFP